MRGADLHAAMNSRIHFRLVTSAVPILRRIHRAICCFTLGKVGQPSFLDLRRIAFPSVKQQIALDESKAVLRAPGPDQSGPGVASGLINNATVEGRHNS